MIDINFTQNTFLNGHSFVVLSMLNFKMSLTKLQQNSTFMRKNTRRKTYPIASMNNVEHDHLVLHE